jgi:hypothetical protein
MYAYQLGVLRSMSFSLWLSVLPKINATRPDFGGVFLGAKTGIANGNNTYCPIGTSNGNPVLAYYVRNKL